MARLMEDRGLRFERPVGWLSESQNRRDPADGCSVCAGMLEHPLPECRGLWEVARSRMGLTRSHLTVRVERSGFMKGVTHLTQKPR